MVVYHHKKHGIGNSKDHRMEDLDLTGHNFTANTITAVTQFSGSGAGLTSIPSTAMDITDNQWLYFDTANSQGIRYATDKSTMSITDEVWVRAEGAGSDEYPVFCASYSTDQTSYPGGEFTFYDVTTPRWDGGLYMDWSSNEMMLWTASTHDIILWPGSGRKTYLAPASAGTYVDLAGDMYMALGTEIDWDNGNGGITYYTNGTYGNALELWTENAASNPIIMHAYTLFNQASVHAGHTAAPITTDGTIYYNSTDNKFYFRENGAWNEIGGESFWKRTGTLLETTTAGDDIAVDSGSYIYLDGSSASKGFYWNGTYIIGDGDFYADSVKAGDLTTENDVYIPENRYIYFDEGTNSKTLRYEGTTNNRFEFNDKLYVGSDFIVDAGSEAYLPGMTEFRTATESFQLSADNPYANYMNVAGNGIFTAGHILMENDKKLSFNTQAGPAFEDAMWYDGTAGHMIFDNQSNIFEWTNTSDMYFDDTILWLDTGHTKSFRYNTNRFEFNDNVYTSGSMDSASFNISGTEIIDSSRNIADAETGAHTIGTAAQTTFYGIGTNLTALSGANISSATIAVSSLANGTDGELITWDASGVAATVATGNAGQVLTSNGAGAAPTFQAAPVTSVFTRTGAVTAQANDYTWAQIDKTTSSLNDVTTKRIGDATNHTDWAADGTQSMGGTARVIKSYHILPNMFHPGTAAFWRSYATPMLRFDDTTSEEIYFTFKMPDDIDLSVNPVLRAHVCPYDNQTAGSNFVFDFEMKYIASGEGINKANDETPTTGAITVSNNQYITAYGDATLNASLMAAGDLISIRTIRDTATDDRNGDACLIELEFRYTANKLGE